jgi:hypothetical protein
MKQTKIRVRNEFPNSMTLWLEPWDEDYGMLPNDEFEVIAKDVDDKFYFQVDIGQEIKVWAVGQVTDIAVYKDNQLLECGHNRLFEK